MARVTVEDCVDKVPNRFELVLLAAHRARSIANGSQITIDPDNDKNPVIALREIADKTVDTDALQAALIQGLQRHVEIDEPEEEQSEFDIAGLDMAAGMAQSVGLGSLADDDADDDDGAAEDDLASVENNPEGGDRGDA